MISFKNVHYRYEPEGIEALRGVSLEIKDHEHVVLIGPNGCGKTTLIQHLNALLLPAVGSVTVDGLDTQQAHNHAKIRTLVGMVFQNPDNQIIGTTVEEDVAFGPENLRLPPAEIRKRVAEALDRAEIGDLSLRNIENLSGGEKRLVAIAGVLAMRPRYIAFDEPTAFLDPAAADRVLEIIDKLRQEGIGIIHITHNMAQAALAERVVVMNRGIIFLDGTPREIFGKADELQQIDILLPQVTQILIKLRKSGLPVCTDIVNVDEAVGQIQGLIKKA
ncbi:MAG: ATP-binding cassette domain-containing protein [Smithellaceae bacterium]|nr:ATP-binding cassette domain-containing protein [Syntrophaceae bacterium]MBP8608402.1 ATP-binding cassette domain-containing protein [Syntrophaceae bacterium]NMD04847.1 ATP-binding cassette domain-containing protein [Deltaproteobacteria bacterium]